MNTPMLSSTIRPLALAAALAFGGFAHAGEAAVEQRLRGELDAVMTELIQSGAFDGEGSLEVGAPARRVADLGLLVDSARADADGLRVLAVTPGGGAERIGLRAGDSLLALNGISLARADGGATLRRTVDALPDGSALAFYVRRDGSTQTLSGSLRSIELPPMRLTVGAGTRLAAADVGGRDVGSSDGLPAGCGRISDFDTAPRQQQLHGAKIISIDGRTPGPSGSKAYRVTAGTHEVKVAEDIESRYLSFSDRARSSGPATRRYKTLAVDVAPGTTTLIAARLIESERNNPTDGAYWEPVAWKQVEEACD